MGHVELLDAERLEAPAGKLKQRGAPHASKADDNYVVHGGFCIFAEKPDRFGRSIGEFFYAQRRLLGGCSPHARNPWCSLKEGGLWKT